MKQKSFSSLYYKQRFHLILAIKEQSQFDMNFVEILKSYFLEQKRMKSVPFIVKKLIFGTKVNYT